MPLPARDLWAKIQKEIRGQPEREQLRILQSYLDGWHDSWKGPYWDLKERLRKLVRKLENTESGWACSRSRRRMRNALCTWCRARAQSAKLLRARVGRGTILSEEPGCGVGRSRSQGRL